MSNLLLDERPVALLPSLVRAVGITDAAVLQQLHYWLQRASKSHDGHTWVYKTYDEWAQEIGVTAKAARGALERLRKSGVVVSMENPMDARDRTLWWRIDHDRLPGSPSAPGGSPGAPGGSSRAGVPDVVSESTDREEGVRASTAVDKEPGQHVVVFDRKPVPPSRLQLAEQLLDEFNAEANTSYAAFTGDGKPSEALKRILGALTEHPDIDGAVWSQGLAAQFVEPWWTSTPAPGVIFGRSQREKTLELARSGRAVVRAESPRDRQLRERQAQADRDGPAMKAVLAQMGIGDANRAAKERRDAVKELEQANDTGGISDAR